MAGAIEVGASIQGDEYRGSGCLNLGILYVEAVQAVLFYRLERWEMTPRIWRLLGGSPHRVACRLTGRQTLRGRDGVWLYPPLA